MIMITINNNNNNNAKIIHLAQKKTARVNNSVCNGDFDLTDIIANERHTHGGF